MDVKIIAISPKGTRKVFPLVARRTTLGRQNDCDLKIPLSEISRKHCEIIVEENSVKIKDFGSSNGTFVNNEKVDERELEAGDIISLAGAINFMVQIDGQPAEIDERKLRQKPQTQVLPEEPKPAAPAAPLSSTSTSSTEESIADQILGESFFMDLDEDEEEEE